jgi:predicted nucleic acid-binding protein
MKRGAVKLEAEYEDLLVNAAFFETVDIDSEIAVLAASLRARYNLRTPDAVQIAASVNGGCEAFLTNDAGLRRVTELRVIVLDDVLPIETASP